MNLTDMFPIRNSLKQRDALSLFSTLLLMYAISFQFSTPVQVNQDGLKLNCNHQLLVCADDVNMMGGSVHTIKKNTKSLVAAS
jgi:hypothetical protein